MIGESFVFPKSSQYEIVLEKVYSTPNFTTYAYLVYGNALWSANQMNLHIIDLSLCTGPYRR